MRQPLYRTSPSLQLTNGDIAAKVGSDLGLPPDPEQQWVLDAIYAEKRPGIPSAFEVCVIAPRQNIKSSTLEIAALTDLFVLGVPLGVWTAHQFKTARKAFEDMRTRILANPEYESRCRFRDSHGEEAITLHTGETLEFHARSTRGGRGFSCDRLTLDEGLFLQPGDMGALVPTMLTRLDAQVRYASSAGLATSEVLRSIRDRGRAGKDRRLAYVEYGAERRDCSDPRCQHAVDTDGCALDDVELWWQANCALWADRITLEGLQDNRRVLTPLEWAREFLSWWEDPVEIGGALDVDRWATLAAPAAERGRRFAFGADLDENRLACIAVAWDDDNGGVHVMLTQDETERADVALPSWVAEERLADLSSRWEAQVALGGASLDLADAVTDAGGEVVEVTGTDFTTACGDVSDGVIAGTLHHGNQAELNTAVRGARWRSVGTDGRKAWRLKDAPGIGPLAAATRAVFALNAQNRTPTFW